jgi:hypothetical protein
VRVSKTSADANIVLVLALREARGGPRTTPGACAGAWILIEAIFWIVQRLRYHKLNDVNRPLPTDDVRQRIRQFHTLASVIDMREFLSGWFSNVPFEMLRRDNVLDFVAYGFWYASLVHM